MDLRQQLGVETPEHVEVHLELAGVGSRTAAAFFDTGLLNLRVILIVVGARPIGTRLSGAAGGGRGVVRDRQKDGGRGAANEPRGEEGGEGGPRYLSEEESRLLDHFRARRAQLEPRGGGGRAAELARRFEARVPRRTTDTE